MEQIDLFETPELIPAEVQEILKDFEGEDNCYAKGYELQRRLLNIGYGMEF